MLTPLLVAFILLLAALTFAPFNAAGGPLDSPGAQKALVCSACHGFAGNSPGNTIPIIAGMAPKLFQEGDQRLRRRKTALTGDGAVFEIRPASRH